MVDLLEGIIRDYDKALSRWKVEAESLENILSESENKKFFSGSESKSILKKRVGNFKDSCDSIFSVIKEKENDIKVFLTTLDLIDDSLKERKKESLLVQNEINIKNVHLARLNGILEDKKMEFNNIDADFNFKQNTITDLEKQIEELHQRKEENIRDEQSSTEALEESKIKETEQLEIISKNEEILNEKQNEIAKLEKIISENQNKIDEFEKRSHDFEEKSFEFKYELKKKEEELNKVRSEFDLLTGNLELKKSELESVEKKLAESQEIIQNSTRDLDNIKDEIKEANNQKELLNADIVKLENYKDYLDTDVKKLKPYLEKLERQRDDFYKISEEVVKLSTEKVDLENNLPMLRQNVELEEIKLQDLQNKTNELASNCDALENQKSRLDNEVANSNSLLTTLRNEKESLEKHSQNLYEKISEYEITKNRYEKEKKSIEEKTLEAKAKLEKIIHELSHKESMLIENTKILTEKQKVFNEIVIEVDRKRNQLKSIEKENVQVIESKGSLKDDLKHLEEKKNTLTYDVEKFEKRKIEIEESLAPFEVKYNESLSKTEEKEKQLAEVNEALAQKQSEFQKVLDEQSEKMAEYNDAKENHTKYLNEVETLKSEIAELENKKAEYTNSISELEVTVKELEGKKAEMEVFGKETPPEMGSSGGDSSVIKQKVNELVSWVDTFRVDLPEAIKQSNSLTKIVNQNFTDLKEVFNKFKDFNFKYGSYARSCQELEGSAPRDNKKILDIFFDNRDLAMKEQERIYSLLAARKGGDVEVKSLMDLYNMMAPEEILVTTEKAVKEGLMKISKFINNVNIEPLIEEINNL